MDVKTAFLNGELKHTIYMDPPAGSSDYGTPDVIWKLEKSLYGLKQALCVWYEKVRIEFNSLSFTHCDADYSIFIHPHHDGHFCIIALYVDDLMILSDSITTLNYHKEALMRVFKMKDLGPIHWFLGLEITCDRAQCLISVSQSRYITDVVS